MKKLIILSLTLLLTISYVISGLSLAFFTDHKFVGSTVFVMGSLSLTSVNTFSALDDPYSYVKQASWTVQNTGSMDLILRVNVNCVWDVADVEVAEVEVFTEDALEVEADLVVETDFVAEVDFDVEADLEFEAEASTEIVTEVVTEPEAEVAAEVAAEIVAVPAYVVTLPAELWEQDANGWYVYRKPVAPNETIRVNAEILVIDKVWQGDLELYFEAEANGVDSGGGL